MADDLWLPTGFLLPNGSKIRKLIVNENQWQILLSDTDNYVLAVKPELRDKWIHESLVGSHLFENVDFKGNLVSFFISKQEYLVSSVQYGPYPENNMQARAFAISLRESRKVNGDTPLHDAIYLEQISRLLPTYTLTESFNDRTVLGMWLSSGVQISTDSTRRLCELLKWMDIDEITTIIDEAEFPEKTDDLLVLTKKKQVERSAIHEKALHHGHQEIGKPRDARFILPGRAELETFLNENVIDIIVNEEKYRRMGIEFPGAIVLHGPPGCGKTFAVERLVEYLDWPCNAINSASIGSPYIHDTSKKIAEVFDKAINSSPSVVLIDEMEAFLTDRGAGQSSGTHHLEEVAEFLRRIPEATKHHVLVIAMTNMLDAIDPAILRRGRFDHIIEVKMPSAEEVKALLVSLFSKLPVSHDIDIDALSQKLENRALSDAAFVVKEAGRFSVKSGKDIIDQESVESALRLLPARENENRRIGF